MSKLRIVAVSALAVSVFLTTSVSPALAQSLNLQSLDYNSLPNLLASSSNSNATVGNINVPQIPDVNQVNQTVNSVTSQVTGNSAAAATSNTFSVAVPSVPTTAPISDQSPTCQGPSIGDVGTYIAGVLAAGGTLIVADSLANAVDTEVFGFTIGRVVQGVINTVDTILKEWLSAFFYGLVATALLLVAGFLLAQAISLNANFLNGNYIVHVVSSSVMGLANLIIILALIVVAFATMFRSDKWGLKQLPKLIFAALLIDFSVTIASWIVGVGTNITKSILYNTCSGDIVNVFNAATTFTAFINAFNATGSVAGVALGSIVATFLSAIVTSIGMLTTAALAFFFAARFIVLTILVGVAPLAWATFVFPNLKLGPMGNPFSAWWKEFLKWVFYGPIIVFFLWITTQIILWLKNIGVTSGGLGSAIFQAMTVVIISGFGLYFALKSGGVITAVTMAGAAFGVGSLAKGVGAIRKSAIKRANLLREENKTETNESEKQKRSAKIHLLENVGYGSEFIHNKIKKVAKDQLGLEVPEFTSGRLSSEAAKQAKEEGLSKEELNKRISNLAKTPDSPDFADLMDYAIKEDKLENPRAYLTDRAKRGLTMVGKGNLFHKIEIESGMSQAGWDALGQGDYVNFKNESDKFIGELDEKELSKLPHNAINADFDAKKPFGNLSEDDLARFRETVNQSIADTGPSHGLLSKVIPKVKPKNHDNLFASTLNSKLSEYDFMPKGKINPGNISKARSSFINDLVKQQSDELAKERVNIMRKSKDAAQVDAALAEFSSKQEKALKNTIKKLKDPINVMAEALRRKADKLGDVKLESLAQKVSKARANTEAGYTATPSTGETKEENK
ncbi:MAG: hypothetical protein M1361_00700 [Patescibacteria group bacterium]|nr:hypothetical protein [Patescibacteria group bacterium]MCL5224130.1 hypothetical protein [Patescibacteria group bacterium]